MTAFDRQQVIETAAKAMDEQFNPDSYPILAAMFSDYAATVVPVIVAAVLKPIRELHVGRERGALAGYCRSCDYAEPCPTVRLCDEVEAAAKGGE